MKEVLLSPSVKKVVAGPDQKFYIRELNGFHNILDEYFRFLLNKQ